MLYLLSFLLEYLTHLFLLLLLQCCRQPSGGPESLAIYLHRSKTAVHFQTMGGFTARLCLVRNWVSFFIKELLFQKDLLLMHIIFLSLTRIPQTYAWCVILLLLKLV